MCVRVRACVRARACVRVCVANDIIVTVSPQCWQNVTLLFKIYMLYTLKGPSNILLRHRAVSR